MENIFIKNRLRKINGRYCGTDYKTFVIGSIGTSSTNGEFDEEYKKVSVAEELKIDCLTDHSFFGNIREFHLDLTKNSKLLISYVSCYEFQSTFGSNNYSGFSLNKLIEMFEDQAKRGLDVITLHSAILKDHLKILGDTKRLIPMTSKGGTIIAKYIKETNMENPFKLAFDKILKICKNYNVTLSLGTSFRTASVCDEWDVLLDIELEEMRKQVEKSIDEGVNTMIEGIGHATLEKIPQYIAKAKKMCYNVPYRTLAVATDIALGYDHIASAIANANAVAFGADAITCITRAEHIGLPSLNDFKEGLITSKIAAHIGELVKLKDLSIDKEMSLKRWQFGCKGDWRLSPYPKGSFEELLKRNYDTSTIECSMCEQNCGINNAKKIMEKKQ